MHGGPTPRRDVVSADAEVGPRRDLRYVAFGVAGPACRRLVRLVVVADVIGIPPTSEAAMFSDEGGVGTVMPAMRLDYPS